MNKQTLSKVNFLYYVQIQTCDDLQSFRIEIFDNKEDYLKEFTKKYIDKFNENYIIFNESFDIED